MEIKLKSALDDRRTVEKTNAIRLKAKEEEEEKRPPQFHVG